MQLTLTATSSPADPTTWGYIAPSASDPTYTPHPQITPFVLHFITHSTLDKLSIPAELHRVVQIHGNLSAYEFYAASTMMDVVLPALSTARTAGECPRPSPPAQIIPFCLSTDTDNPTFSPPSPPSGPDHNLHASSSIPLSIMCETPLLTTHHLTKTHPSLRVLPTIQRPSYLREIEAIKVLRAGSSYVPSTARRPSTPPPGVREEVVRMIERGWQLGEGAWEAGRGMLDERGREVGRKILGGM